MGSPTIFAGSRTKLLSSAGLLNKDNSINDNNGIVNYIKNGHAEVSAVGWEGYSSNVNTAWIAANVNTTTDTITATGHTLTNGQRVAVGTLGSLPSPLAVGTMYYVINVATNTFQLSLTKGGSVLDLTTAGIGSSYLIPVDPVGVTSGGGYALTRSTTSPLAGSASFLFTRNTPNIPGLGSKYDFTIDSSSQAKVMSISFDYIVNSGTFTAGSATTDSDLEVWIWDKTNNVYIQPSTYKLYSNSTTITAQFSANFQTAYNSTSYSLLLNNASIGSSNYELKIDNIQVQPTQYTYGTPITDWASYTPTLTGFGTVSGVQFFSRRVGSNLEVNGRFTPGTNTGVQAQITLGYGGVNANVTVGTVAVNAIVGFGGTARIQPDVVQIMATSGNNYLTLAPANVSISGFSPALGNNFQNSIVIGFQASVPITGWSSCVQMSDSADTRVVAARYTTTSATTGGIINFSTKDYDTHGATTVGASWKYTAPTPGVYQLSSYVMCGGNIGQNAIQVFKNGVLNQSLGGQGFVTANTFVQGSGSIYLNSGDYIDFRIQGTAVSVTDAYVTIARLSGPASIAATDTVAASYWLSANFTTNSTTPINFDSKEIDTTGAVTTSATAWKFTAPTAGLYLFNGVIYTTGTSVDINIYKNGSSYKFVGTLQNSTTTRAFPNGIIRLLAGDYIDFRGGTSNTIYGGALSSSATAYVSIVRIGLY